AEVHLQRRRRTPPDGGKIGDLQIRQGLAHCQLLVAVNGTSSPTDNPYTFAGFKGWGQLAARQETPGRMLPRPKKAVIHNDAAHDVSARRVGAFALPEGGQGPGPGNPPKNTR